MRSHTALRINTARAPINSTLDRFQNMIIDTSAKHYIVDIEDTNACIFRLMEVNRLFEIFESGIISYTAPKLWEDPFENFLEYSYGTVNKKPNMRVDYSGYGKRIFGQCWTLNMETDAIWRIYSPNLNRVKVKTTVRKMQTMLEEIKDDWFRSYIGKVDYKEESEIKSSIADGISTPESSAFLPDKLIRNFYLSKRRAFEYEKEVRILINLPPPEEGYSNSKYQRSKNQDICDLPVNNLPDLFDEIVFDPRMPDSLVRAYTAYLKNNLSYTNCLIKSELYNKPEIRAEIKDSQLYSSI
jgi:hypothetical protein